MSRACLGGVIFQEQSLLRVSKGAPVILSTDSVNSADKGSIFCANSSCSTGGSALMLSMLLNIPTSRKTLDRCARRIFPNLPTHMSSTGATLAARSRLFHRRLQAELLAADPTAIGQDLLHPPVVVQD